jgi:O-antigen/teichoic acid export membrane protein
VLRCLSPILILAGLRATQTALLQRQMRFRELAVRTTLAESIGGLVGVVLALGGLGVWSLVGQAIARTIASVLVLWRVVEWRPRFNLTKRSLLDISSFGIPVVGDRVVTLVQSKADDLIIGLVLGATTLGYYTVGYRMLTYMTQLLSGTVQSVALPALARLQIDLGRFRRAFLGILQFLSLGAFPAFIGVAFVARDAVPLLFGPQWTPSIPVMQVLALAGAAKILQIASGTAFMASGRPGMQLRLNLVTTSLAVLGFALVVRNGIVAVATVHLWVAVLALPLHVLALRDIVGITLGSYARAIRTSTLGIVGMSVMLLILAQGRSVAGPSLGWLALTVVVGMLAYLSLTYFMDRGLYRQARAALQEGILSSPEERSAELGLGG